VKSLTNPLAFIAEDHLRTRQICALMDAVATKKNPEQADFERILTYLNVEFSTHLADEDDDLFPLLRQRCEPEDEIDKLLDQLEEDHRKAGEQAPYVRDVLLRCVGGASKLSSDECDALRAFSGNLRRHLVFENAIVLPLAQARLNAHDLDQLRQCLAARRTDGGT
jgi:iron-sulfur cluster repair protein YtfE (RIC family)